MRLDLSQQKRYNNAKCSVGAYRCDNEQWKWYTDDGYSVSPSLFGEAAGTLTRDGTWRHTCVDLNAIVQESKADFYPSFWDSGPRTRVAAVHLANAAKDSVFVVDTIAVSKAPVAPVLKVARANLGAGDAGAQVRGVTVSAVRGANATANATIDYRIALEVAPCTMGYPPLELERDTEGMTAEAAGAVALRRTELVSAPLSGSFLLGAYGRWASESIAFEIA